MATGLDPLQIVNRRIIEFYVFYDSGITCIGRSRPQASDLVSQCLAIVFGTLFGKSFAPARFRLNPYL